MTDEKISKNGTDIYTTTHTEQLKEKITARFKKLGVTLATSGWPGRIDSGLTTAAEFSKTYIDALAASWTPRWTDTLYQDLRSSIISLEGDARYYSDLNYRLATYVIEQFAQDGELNIHNSEVQAGWLTVASEIATTDAAAQQSIVDGLTASAQLYKQMLQDPTVIEGVNNPTELAKKRAASATAASLTPYQSVYDNASAKGYVQYNESVLSGSGPVVQPTGGVGVRVDAVAAMYSNATDSFSFDAIVYGTSTQSAARMASAYADAAASSLASKTRQKTWAIADIDFRRARTQLQLNARILRRMAFETSPRFCLNSVDG